jgi:tryptophan-rich sensory protein
MRFPVDNLNHLLVTFIGIAVLINGILFYFGIYDPVVNKRLPPGYVVGIVWTVLIGCMAYSQYLVMQKTKGGYVQWLIPALFLYCVLYPFYTTGFRNKCIIDFANVLTIIFAAVVAYVLYDITKKGSLLISLTAVWASYATWATI